MVNILSDVLHESVEDLHNHPVLAAYDWDSLSSLEALAQLESQLAITLDLRSYQAARTDLRPGGAGVGDAEPDRPPDSGRRPMTRLGNTLDRQEVEILAIGAGPANLALAVALEELAPRPRARAR